MTLPSVGLQFSGVVAFGQFYSLLSHAFVGRKYLSLSYIRSSLLHQTFVFIDLSFPHSAQTAMSKQGHAEGTTERLNERLEEQSRSFPVSEHPSKPLLGRRDIDEGIDGTGVTWPSRTAEIQKNEKAELAKQEKAQEKEHQNDETDQLDDDEGIDGSGVTWSYRE
jgi:hypothetical protein